MSMMEAGRRTLPQSRSNLSSTSVRRSTTHRYTGMPMYNALNYSHKSCSDHCGIVGWKRGKGLRSQFCIKDLTRGYGKKTWWRSRTAVIPAASSKRIVEVDGETLEREIANRDRPIVLDAYATWCGPCVLLAKELEQVAEKMGDSVKILKLDVDKNDAIASALAIQGLPTLIFVPKEQNKPALRTEGLLPAQTIIDIIENDLGAEKV